MLTAQKCIPCRGDLPPMTIEEIEPLLSQVPGWVLVRGEPMKLTREFKFKNFKEALSFVNKVGELAESEGHHPNILIHNWNRVTLELYTHKINGLHQNDFILAAKISSSNYS